MSARNKVVAQRAKPSRGTVALQVRIGLPMHA